MNTITAMLTNHPLWGLLTLAVGYAVFRYGGGRASDCEISLLIVGSAGIICGFRSSRADPISPLQRQAAYYVTRNLATMLDGVQGSGLASRDVLHGWGRFVATGLGLPCVHVETDFSAPLRLGDVLEVEAAVVKLGRSSVELDVRVRRDGGAVECARMRYVVACTDLRKPAAVPLPAGVRAMFLAHLAAPA